MPHQNPFPATPVEQLKEIKKGVVEIIPEDEFLKKLENSYQNKKALIVKLGVDPSRPDIHIGHTVIINKLKLLQDFGHDVHFLIGDFTARIGDPTGKSKARVQLGEEEVRSNAKTYEEQIFKILDPKKTKIVFNSTWLKEIHLASFLQMLMTTTVTQLLSREDFSERIKNEQAIFLHEFMYPLLQGYDSVAMKADLELGGIDQKFNLLMGRHLQKQFQQPQQAVLMMPLLEGLDGVNKMSKSLNNTISLTGTSKDMFGKVMSISDSLMLRYYELISKLSVGDFQNLKSSLQEGSLHPMEAKKRLAAEIVENYHGAGSGERERKNFEELFSKKSSEADLPKIQVKKDLRGGLNLVDFMLGQGFVSSKTEARRLLQQRAVRLDGNPCQEDWISLEQLSEVVLRVGKLKIVRLLVS